jgi:hypothetical protein
MATIANIPDEAIKDSRAKINTNFINLNADKAEGADLTSHTGNVSNPHSVSATQVGKDTAQWNANKIQGKEVDATDIGTGKVLAFNASSDKIVYVAPDTPGAHESSHEPGQSDALLLDEDDMVSNSATKGASQQSIKAYADTKVISPATNTADYIPQWDGANSKTLKNGVALSSISGDVLKNQVFS